MNIRVLIMCWFLVFAVAPVFGEGKNELKTDKEMLSYALGASLAHNLKMRLIWTWTSI